MEITVLCKVVDNFGDIGVVWRLCRQLKKKYPKEVINLIVDDLCSFNRIWDSVKIDKSFQVVDDINVYYWKDDELCRKEFGVENQNKLQVILECFQCGRPDWLEKILFEEAVNHTVHIIMIDYLTAEDYAETFHELESLTRRAIIQKVNFMPGFTNKTGGLIIDDNWMSPVELKPENPILFFTYEKSEKFWHSVFDGFVNADIKNDILIARGKGFDSFINAYNSYFNKEKLHIKKLDFINQSEWDNLMRTCSLLFIRGEESMSRACLSGIPFVWHAYPQSDEYQMVKMNALLNKINESFSKDFHFFSKLWNCFNLPENEIDYEELKTVVSNFYLKRVEMADDFKKFANILIRNGDLADNLMTFIKEKCIID